MSVRWRAGIGGAGGGGVGGRSGAGASVWAATLGRGGRGGGVVGWRGAGGGGIVAGLGAGCGVGGVRGVEGGVAGRRAGKGSGLLRGVGVFGVLGVYLLFFGLVRGAHGWTEWRWHTEGPGPREGHSLVVHPDGDRLLLFGGRSNDVVVRHLPTTYEIQRVNGSLEFLTYDEQLLQECPAASALLEEAVALETEAAGSGAIIRVIERARSVGVNPDIDQFGTMGASTPPLADESLFSDSSPNATEQALVEQQLASAVLECYGTQTALLFNDVWEYDLSCTRAGPQGCLRQGWRAVDRGARRGGCRIVYSTLICTHPGERTSHAAAAFDDGTLFVYGGRSWICDDLCSDMWAFNVTRCDEARANASSHGLEGAALEAATASECQWSNYGDLGRAGPGRRWRFAQASDGKRLFVFGGQRMWHGFAPENSLSNRWNRTDRYPFGGFLDDLWVYEHLPPRPLGLDSAFSVVSALQTARQEKEELVAVVGGTVGGEGIPEEDTTLSFALADEDTRGFGDLTLPLARFASDQSLVSSGAVPRGTVAPEFNWWGSGVSGGEWWRRGGGHRGMHTGLSPPARGSEWIAQYSSANENLTSDDASTVVAWPWQVPGAAIPRAVAQAAAIPEQLWDSDGGYAIFAPNTSTLPVGSVVLVLDGYSGPDRLDPDLERNHTVVGVWRQVFPRESCYSAPGEEWEAREDIRCTIHWPQRRSGAALTIQDGGLWLHGGFNSFFPFPQVDGRGAAAGTGRIASDGLSPYPDLPFFLDDLWRYNLDTGLWREVTPASAAAPEARRGHLIVVAGDTLLLFGGYGSNTVFGDFWLYNTSTSRWLQKTEFVHPIFPDTCTSDVVESDGDRRFLAQSVVGVPTRGTVLDGVAGRATEHVEVAQSRRRAPGWDGCRDRRDGRTDLEASLQWEQPRQRFGMAGAFSPKHRSLTLFGGQSLAREELRDDAVTRSSRVAGDLWSYQLDTCVGNCTGHGVCHFGFCICHPGWYGVDCSNVSCPGDYCSYDPFTFKQECVHCCHAGVPHEDSGAGAEYAVRERKLSCDANNPGESHGICDGFGKCQCAPPFLTIDCSVKDCPNKCSGNGWCSLEFPNARCACDAGWTGDDCSVRLCLNNCSWPNGECVNGFCQCAFNANPYNRTIDWVPFQGEDCSFVAPFAGAPPLLKSPATLTILLFAALYLLLDQPIQVDNAVVAPLQHAPPLVTGR